MLVLVDTAASISTISPASPASIPKAVNASVTKSEACPRSISATVARLRTLAKPAIISVFFQPAIPMYSMACPTSVALYLVSAPSLLASSINSSNSGVPVTPAIAPTLAICDSKSIGISIKLEKSRCIPVIFSKASLISVPTLLAMPTKPDKAPLIVSIPLVN